MRKHEMQYFIPLSKEVNKISFFFITVSPQVELWTQTIVFPNS